MDTAVMRTAIKTTLATAATAAVIAGGAVVTAAPASAAYGCERVTINTAYRMACETAFNRASMVPLTAGSVVSYQYDWCQIKAIKGASEAYRLLNNRVGITKGNAIGYGADAWRC